MINRKLIFIQDTDLTRMDCIQRGNMNEDQCGWQFQHMDNNNILIVSRRRRQEMSKYEKY